MEFLSSDNNLKLEIKHKEITDTMIAAVVTKVPKFEEKQMDVNLLKLVVGNVENATKPKYGFDTTQLVLGIYQKCFANITANDLEAIGKNIEYLKKNIKINPPTFALKIWRMGKRMLSKK